MNAYPRISRAFRRAALVLPVLALTTALAACGGTKSAEQSKAAVDPNTVKIAYGVSFRVPQGWSVDGMITPDQATDAVLDERAAAGGPVMLASLQRTANTAEGKNGMAAVFLAVDGKHILPKEKLQAATPQVMQEYAKAQLQHDKEQARRAKAESNFVSWDSSKGEKDGRLTLTERAEAKRPGGRLQVYDVSIYLNNGKGIVIKTITDPDVPGNEDQLRSFVDSVRIAR